MFRFYLRNGLTSPAGALFPASCKRTANEQRVQAVLFPDSDSPLETHVDQFAGTRLTRHRWSHPSPILHRSASEAAVQRPPGVSPLILLCAAQCRYPVQNDIVSFSCTRSPLRPPPALLIDQRLANPP